VTRRILVSCRHLQRCFDDFAGEFAKLGYDCHLPEVDQQLKESWLLEHAGEYDGVIAGDDPFSRPVLEAGRRGRLRALVKWGIGVDAIDLGALEELDIDFAHTPGAFGDEVADVAVGYVVTLARGLIDIDRSVRNGGWAKPVGISLRGKTLGIVGLGSIGRSIADRARAFGMNLIGSDVSPIDAWTEYGPQVDLNELLAEADFVVLACALTDANRGMIDERALDRMKSSAFLVNVARGPLVDEFALCEHLERETLRGAALDVFEVEPLPDESPLRDLDNCIFGSHNGSNTQEAVDRVNRLSVDLLLKFLGDRSA